MQGLIGKKIGMTQIFNKESGKITPVSIVQTGVNVVCQVKSAEKDGYRPVQLGFESRPEKKMNKALLGHFKKCNATPSRIVKEFKLDSADEQVTPGQTIGVELFENVGLVDVTGVSKGRGFTGGVKRYNFHRGRETHGRDPWMQSPPDQGIIGVKYHAGSRCSGASDGRAYGRVPGDHAQSRIGGDRQGSGNSSY
jgi:large subunit ribosomal protein L3